MTPSDELILNDSHKVAQIQHMFLYNIIFCAIYLRRKEDVTILRWYCATLQLSLLFKKVTAFNALQCCKRLFKTRQLEVVLLLYKWIYQWRKFITGNQKALAILLMASPKAAHSWSSLQEDIDLLLQTTLRINSETSTGMSLKQL